MDTQPIRKLILPVAGMGRRLEPLTLTTPKNLLTVAGKTIIEHLLGEVLGTSIEDVVLVISPEHRAQFEEFLKAMREKYPALRFSIREQRSPYGHGHALYQAADIYGQEPVIVRFCDDMLVGGEATLSTMMAIYKQYGRPLLLLKRVPHKEVFKYGVVEGDPLENGSSVYRVRSIVEKPSVEEAPSDLVSVGGYVLTPEMLSRIPAMIKIMEEKNDALLMPYLFADEIARGGEVYGWEHPGIWLDCGTLEGYKYANEFMSSRARAKPRSWGAGPEYAEGQAQIPSGSDGENRFKV
jgi:UTP--glucose-1-phosphate uridylyltransferase